MAYYVLVNSYDISEDFNPMDNIYVENKSFNKKRFRKLENAIAEGNKLAMEIFEQHEIVNFIRIEIEDAYEIDNDKYSGEVQVIPLTRTGKIVMDESPMYFG